MPWPCRLVEDPELNEHGNVDTGKRAVGDMWYLRLAPAELERRREQISAQYFAENAHRPPLVVLLPGRIYFLVDGKCFEPGRGWYDGWQVSGEPPLISVSPSINIVGCYHGFLAAGVIGDDVDGRRFDAAGEAIK
jgi:hypothetical protein